ncbi:hypothetical protein F5Y10DRAFT_285304 [Nemania abortiva]|nr:hypothetical protein F5Y10DRAFT_285304 [Nemania abortiva]
MDEGQQSRPSLIERLPTELVCMVLSALPDVMSLQAAALSCPLFYSAFMGAKTSTTTAILLKQLDISVLPTAIAASESAEFSHTYNLGPQRLEAFEEFMARHFNPQQQPTLPKSLSLNKALRIERLHSGVEQWAKQSIEDPTYPHDPSSGPDLTYEDVCRTQRALYRREAYCNLFGEAIMMQPHEYVDKRRRFTLNFPQESDTYEFILRFIHEALWPVFDIILNRISWNEYKHKIVGYSPFYSEVFMIGVLGLDLEKLRRIVMAETEEDRARVLANIRVRAPRISSSKK